MQYPQWFSDFVNSVYSDLGDREDYSVQYLIGWFLSPSNLGTLNAQIGTCYQVTGYLSNSGDVTGLGIEPQLNGQELAIYKSNFDVFFYNREAKIALSGSYGVGSWTNIREGDSSVTRLNRSELARTFNQFKKDAQEATDNLVINYLKNNTLAQSVDGSDTVSDTYWVSSTDRGFYYPRSMPGI